MSDTRADGHGLPSSLSMGQRVPEPSLDMLALAEMLAQMRAASDVPRLSALLAALPDMPDTLADAILADADEAANVDHSTADSTDAGFSHTTAAPLPLGTQRWLDSVFKAAASASEEYTGSGAHEDTPAMVAESPGYYHVTESEPLDSVATHGEAGLLALARGCGLDSITLAARVMLSPEVLRWLDSVALAREHQPDALVAHLVGALAIERERVHEALAHGGMGAEKGIEVGVETAALLDVIRSAESLTPAARDYWLTLLSSRAEAAGERENMPDM